MLRAEDEVSTETLQRRHHLWEMFEITLSGTNIDSQLCTESGELKTP